MNMNTSSTYKDSQNMQSIPGKESTTYDEPMTITYPWWASWSRIAAIEFLRQISWFSIEEATEMVYEGIDVREEATPAVLAESLAVYLPNWMFLLPVSNNNWWAVLQTIEFVINYHRIHGKMPINLWNVEIDIKHCLCWKPWLSDKDISNWKVYSHPQAIKQCKSKIKKWEISDCKEVGWTEEKIETAKENAEVLLLIDEYVAIKNWLEVYDREMWPKGNRTTFAVFTWNPDAQVPKPKWNDDINIWIIEVDNSPWGLLLSLLPLILLEKPIDMKAITSSINDNSAMIWIVSDKKSFEEIKDNHTLIKEKESYALRQLTLKLNKIFKKDYGIKLEHKKGKSYTLSSDNEPWALVKMLILLEYNNINLGSIKSEIKWDKVYISVEMEKNIEWEEGSNELIWIEDLNMPEWKQEYFTNLVYNHSDRIHEIITN